MTLAFQRCFLFSLGREASACRGLRDRLIRRSLHARWRYAIHEVIPLPSEYRLLFRPDIVIFHDKLHENEPGRNLRILEKLLAEGTVLDDYLKSYYVRELAAAGQYEKAESLYRGMVREQADPVRIHYARFFYTIAMKRQKRYRELLRELLAETESLGPAPDEGVCCMIDEMYLRLGDCVSARAWYTRAQHYVPPEEDFTIHFGGFSGFRAVPGPGLLCGPSGRGD